MRMLWVFCEIVLSALIASADLASISYNGSEDFDDLSPHLLVPEAANASSELLFHLHLTPQEERRCKGSTCLLLTTRCIDDVNGVSQDLRAVVAAASSGALDMCHDCERSSSEGYICRMNASNVVARRVRLATYCEYLATSASPDPRLLLWRQVDESHTAILRLRLPEPNSYLTPREQGSVEMTVAYQVELGRFEQGRTFHGVEVWFGEERLYTARDTEENGWELTNSLLDGEVRQVFQINVKPDCYELRIILNAAFVPQHGGADKLKNRYTREVRRKVCVGDGSEDLSKGWEGSLSPKVKLFCQDMACKCELDDTCRDDEDTCEASSLPDMFQYVEESMMSMSRYMRDDFSFFEDGAVFDMKVFVMSLSSRRDRRRHMESLLNAVGFANVSFPKLTLQQDIDPEGLISSGYLSREGERLMSRTPWTMKSALRPCLARAMDHLRVLEEGLASGAQVIGVFEDDLMIHDDIPSLNHRIKSALEELPTSADLLYLEYCYERCERHCSVSSFVHINRAYRPRCAGAILFMAQGARKVLQLCKPIFGAIDNMLPILIERGHLEAYLLNLPAFFQDAFWGSDVGRQIQPHNPKQHVPVASVCEEDWFRAGQFTSLDKFYVATVVSPDHSYVDGVYGRDTAACMRQQDEDVVLVPRSALHIFRSVPPCRLEADLPQCLVSHRSARSPAVQVLCEPPLWARGIPGVCSWGDGQQDLMYVMCEGPAGAALLFSPSSDCHGSRSCHFSVLTQDAAADGQVRIKITTWFSLLLLNERAAERRDVCYLLYGEEFAANHHEYLRLRLAGDAAEAREKQGFVKLVYSRQAEGRDAPVSAGIMEAPAALSISYLRWLLLETALQRFEYPMVEFAEFRFCHLDALLAGACIQEGGWVDKISNRTTEQLRERWVSDTTTMTLLVHEVSTVLSLFEIHG